jgi:hypothetical protein
MQAQRDNAVYIRSLNEERIAGCRHHNQCYTTATNSYTSSRAGYTVLMRCCGTVTRCDTVFSSTFVSYRKACEKLQLCFWFSKCNSINSLLMEQPGTQRSFSSENFGMSDDAHAHASDQLLCIAFLSDRSWSLLVRTSFPLNQLTLRCDWFWKG